MSYLKLNPGVRDYVETETGRDVPDPNSPAFESFLTDLKVTRPELAEGLVQGLEVEGAELPEEVQARRAGRREGRRNIIRRLFFSRSYEGDPNLNKRKALFVIVGVLVAALPFAFLVDQLAARRSAAREASLAASAVMDEPLILSVPLPTPEEQLLQVDGSVPKSSDLPSPPSSPIMRNNLPPPPGPVDPSISGAPPAITSPSTSLLTVAENTSTTSGQPQGLSVLLGQSSPPTALGVFAATTAPEQLNVVASTARGDSSITPGTQATELNLIAKAQPTTTPTPTLTVLLKDVLPSSVALATPPPSTALGLSSTKPSEFKASEGFPLHWTSDQAIAQQGTTAGKARFPPPPVLPEEVSLTAPPQGLSATPGEPSNGADSPIPSHASPVTFQPGVQIPAQLVTGIAVTESVSSPVIAETPAGGTWCGETSCPAVIWLGTAKLARPGRIELRLEQAVVDGEARIVSATALGKDNIPGLEATVSDTSPTVVQDLLRAAAGGVSDYVKALANRQSVTVRGEGVVIRDVKVPSLDQFLLGRTSKLFDLPSTQTALIRIAQVAAGTELMVLYGFGE